MKFVGRGSWFRTGILRQIGNGDESSFWEDVWSHLGDRLCVLFPRLFILEIEYTVADRVLVGESGSVFCGNWRRVMFV